MGLQLPRGGDGRHCVGGEKQLRCVHRYNGIFLGSVCIVFKLLLCVSIGFLEVSRESIMGSDVLVGPQWVVYY